MSDHASGHKARDQKIEQASDNLAAAASHATEAVQEAAEGQVDIVTGLARTAREAASRLHDTAPGAARLVESSADAAEELSKRFRDHSLSDLSEQLSTFASRQPAAFVGCGVLAGFLIAQLLPPSR